MTQEVNADIKNYLERYSSIQKTILNYLDEEESNEKDFKAFFDNFKIQNSNFNIKEIFNMLRFIINDHHRNEDFFIKLEKIIIYFKDDFMKTFSNKELFDFFIQNNGVILILLENQMIKLDNDIVKVLKRPSNMNFFLPEIEAFYYDNELKFNGENQTRLDKYKKIRKLGVNNDDIAEMIRNDSIEQFIIHVNKTNLQLNSKIMDSPFETNLYLKQNKTTLIEYATFYGSVQIFNYLKLNGVSLTTSLMNFAIHSNKAEMIHLLEENDIPQINSNYEPYIYESLKCYHNEIANYFIEYKNINKLFIYYCLQIYNYEFIPIDQDSYSKYELPIYDIYNSIQNHQELFHLLYKESYLDINKVFTINASQTKSILSYAFECSNINMIKFLLSQPNIDVNLKTIYISINAF